MKSIKRFALSAMGVAMLLVLTGCVRVDKATGKPIGFIWNTIGAPMAEAIKYFATDQGLGFGVAIIIVTIIVRLIILPLGIYQSWKATLHSEKMNALKHVLEPHQTRLKEATTQEEKLEAQQALFAAQKEHGISMFGGVGCFPILLQMPFFSAIYFAAQHTEGVAQASYLGIPLGSPSMIFGCLRRCPLLSSIAPFTSRSRRRNAKRTNQENGLREPNHDCCLLPHFTSQCHTLLGCRWFHDDSPTVYRQLYRSSKTSQKSP